MDFLKDAEGKTFYGWKLAGGVPGGFQEPRGFAFTKGGDLIVTDGIDGRIQIFTPELEYKSQLVTKAGEKKPADVGSPADVAVDENTVYVAEPLGSKVFVFTLQ
jgi:DNA-binding beta-propeller fold protein YncE